MRLLLPLLGLASLARAGGTPPPEITTTTLPSGTELVPYFATLSATNGTPPVVWTEVRGFLETSAASTFAYSGTGQGWIGDDDCWGPVALPFPFPFFGSVYTNCYVDTKGVIRFDRCEPDWTPTEAELRTNPIIAALWGDWLTTLDGNPIEDIYLEAAPDSLLIRWQGEKFGGGSPVNFSATLHVDGRVVFRYGPGNQLGGIVGLSAGDDSNFVISPLSQSGSMENAEDRIFTPVESLPAGLVLSPHGEISGVPTLAVAGQFTVLVRDEQGRTDVATLPLTIDPNPNQRPVITDATPPEGSLGIPAGLETLFSVSASDPEGQPLAYTWTWNGQPVGSDTNLLAVMPGYAEAGEYVLECRVSDGVWTQQVFAAWSVTVLDDNDGDGLDNRTEIDLGRDPNDDSDGGGTALLAGRLLGAGEPIAGGEITLAGIGGAVYHQTITDDLGNYVVYDIQPGTYRVKAGAPGFADHWHAQATHFTNATPLQVEADASLLDFDFTLQPGESPAFLFVTSSPDGAEVLLNGHPTGQTTPTLVPVGEAVTEFDLERIPYLVTVRRSGSPDPTPRYVDTFEAQTTAVDFDLAGSSGALNVLTDPAGAEVYVDQADVLRGTSPVVVDNLAPGPHLVLVRRAGSLLPRLVVAQVTAGTTTALLLPLNDPAGGTAFTNTLVSVPAAAEVLVNYLPVGSATDATLGHLDSFERVRPTWNTTHTALQVRKTGFLPRAARYADTGRVDPFHFLLRADPTGPDLDGDGLPDAWEDAYGLNALPPGRSGAQDDADSDGLTNAEERRAGTSPVSAASRFASLPASGVLSGGFTYGFTFASVPGQYYRVERALQPADPYQVVIPTFLATGPETTVFVPLEGTEDAGFFRAVLLAPP
jgi:hypothetical protein